jgi:hypothetical protein
MSFEGGCHCGSVTFSVDADVPTKALSCNCPICRQKGLLLSFVPANKFTLTSGEDALTTYEFDAHKIAHRFCMICGCQPFAAGKNADGRWCTLLVQGEMIPIQSGYAMTGWRRTESGRPAANIRFSTATPMAASVCWPAKPRARSRGPISNL